MSAQRTQFSPGRQWYCDRTRNGTVGTGRANFTFVIIGPPTDSKYASPKTHKVCRIESDRGGDQPLRSAPGRQTSTYSHAHLKKYAFLLPEVGDKVVEIEKNQELFVVYVDERIGMAYSPGGTAAVSATRSDFGTFFRLETK